jgi:hypothetical protein
MVIKHEISSLLHRPQAVYFQLDRKEQLNEASKDFAWEVLQLEISL